MEKITQYLEQLNFSEIEAKLYLTLLKTGATSVKNLANSIGIKRTTTYLYIDQLAEKGLIVKVIKGTQKQVAPSDLGSLEQLVKQKVQTANTLEQELPQIIKMLQVDFPQKNESENAEIKYYKGKLGVKKIYEEALKAKELRSYFNIELTKPTFPDNTNLFIESLKINKTIKIFEILEDSSVAKKQVAEFQGKNDQKEKYFYKFLPSGVRLSAADVLIYDGTVAIINVKNQITGIVLKNEDYYFNSKELFDLIWKVLPQVGK